MKMPKQFGMRMKIQRYEGCGCSNPHCKNKFAEVVVMKWIDGLGAKAIARFPEYVTKSTGRMFSYEMPIGLN